MADYVPVAIDVGTGPAGSDGDTDRAAFTKAMNDLAQLWAGLGFDSSSNVATVKQRLLVGTGATIAPTSGIDTIVIDEGTANTGMSILSSGIGALYFGDAGSSSAGRVSYDHSTDELGFAAGDVVRMTLTLGLVVGAPTGGDKGAGTVNAVGVYDDGSLLTDYVFEYYIDGEAIDTHAKALAFDQSMLDLDTFVDYWKREKSLPNMPTRAEFTEAKMSLGDLTQRLWEVVELQAVHISQLNERLKAVENG